MCWINPKKVLMMTAISVARSSSRAVLAKLREHPVAGGHRDRVRKNGGADFRGEVRRLGKIVADAGNEFDEPVLHREVGQTDTHADQERNRQHARKRLLEQDGEQRLHSTRFEFSRERASESSDRCRLPDAEPHISVSLQIAFPVGCRQDSYE